MIWRTSLDEIDLSGPVPLFCTDPVHRHFSLSESPEHAPEEVEGVSSS